MPVCSLSLALLLSLAPSEHEDLLVPQDPRGIAATRGGELWILEGQANALLHVSKGGVFERVGAPSLRVLQSLAWDESTRSLLLLTGGSEWFGIGQRGPEFPLELTTLGGTRVPVPTLVAFRYALDLGVIGAAATLGYQLGNGGRAAR